MMRGAMIVVSVALALGACGGGGDDDDDDVAMPDAAAVAPDAAAPDPTWTNFAESFFATFCHMCHGPGDALRDYSQLSMVRAESERIRSGVDSGQFPIGMGPKPTREQRDTLLLWIDNGLPE